MTAPKAPPRFGEAPDWFVKWKQGTQGPWNVRGSWAQFAPLATAAYEAGRRDAIDAAAKVANDAGIRTRTDDLFLEESSIESNMARNIAASIAALAGGEK